jgi:hypothetical protein
MNNLGIYSAGGPQGPFLPDLILLPCGPIVAAIQIAGNNNGFGFVNTGNIPAPVTPLFLTVSDTTPQVTDLASGTVVVTNMTLTWPINSNALITFDADYGIVGPLIDITAAGAADTAALAAQLAALPGGVLHGAVFGNGEILTAGIYDVVTPAAIQGILTLDGGGDPNALFVIRVVGALTSVAASQVLLTNGATANNVFWVSQGASALGANTVFSGTALAVGGAATIGNASVVNGRLLSTIGAVNTDTSVVTQPGATTTPVVLGVLGNFALFTANGAVANTGASVINGNIGTNLGAISGYGLPTIVNGNVYIPGSLAAGPVSADFGIYVNGVLVPASLVTVSGPTTIPAAHVTTTATVPLVIGDVVTAESTVALGVMTVTNRTLSILQVA